MSELHIETNVPIPDTPRLELVETFRKMKIAHSVLLPERHSKTYHQWVYTAAMRAGIKVKARKDKGSGRVRVWRIA